MHLLYVTICDHAAGLDLAQQLVGEGLAACANVSHGHTAVYRWQGKMCSENETALILKTSDELVDALTERVVALHHDEVPCVLAWPITAGHGPYLDWLHSNVGPETTSTSPM